jgi:hypothetical protein
MGSGQLAKRLFLGVSLDLPDTAGKGIAELCEQFCSFTQKLPTTRPKWRGERNRSPFNK